jgi:hypothetical protein
MFFVPGDRETWVSRIESACTVIERLFQGETLRLATPYHPPLDQVPIDDRDRFLRKALKTRTRWFHLSNGKAAVGYGSDMRDEGMLSIGGALGGGAPYQAIISVMFPTVDWSISELLLTEIGDTLEADHAQLSPSATFLWLRWAQWGHSREGISRGPSTSNLPRFKYHDLSANEQPDILGWLNYWSAATCEYVGFSSLQPDELLKLSYKTKGGAWLVKLTPEPLDVSLPAHMRILEDCYVNFPKVGTRVAA